MKNLKSVFIFELIFFLPLLTHAQGMDYMPNHTGGWQVAAITEDRFPVYKLKPEEKQVLLKKAEQVTTLIKTYPGFNPPKGFEMKPYYEMKYIPDPEQNFNALDPSPLEVNVELMHYYKKGDKIQYQTDREYAAVIQVHFNDLEKITARRELVYEKHNDQQEVLYIFEPTVIGTFGNATVYENGSLIFTRPGKKLWVPVTAKQYMEALLRYNSNLNGSGLPAGQLAYDMIKAEMDDLTPAQLQMPAYHEVGSEKISRIATEKGDGKTAIVMLNPDYFDKNKPRTALQLLVIDFNFGINYFFEEPIEDTGDPEANSRVNLYKFVNQFDFKKFQVFVE